MPILGTWCSSKYLRAQSQIFWSLNIKKITNRNKFNCRWLVMLWLLTGLAKTSSVVAWAVTHTAGLSRYNSYYNADSISDTVSQQTCGTMRHACSRTSTSVTAILSHSRPVITNVNSLVVLIVFPHRRTFRLRFFGLL